MTGFKSKEEVDQIIKDYENVIRSIESERDLAYDKCLELSVCNQTLREKLQLSDDKSQHREMFVKSTMKNLKINSKEKKILVERIKLLESEKNNSKKKDGSLKRCEASVNKHEKKQVKKKNSKIPRSKECFLSEKGLKNTISRYQILPPLRQSKKVLPPTSFFVPLKPPATVVPKPPSLPLPVKRRPTSFFVPLADKQPAQGFINGSLNPFKVLPPVLEKPRLPEDCVNRPSVGSAKKVRFVLPDVEHAPRRRQ